MALVSVGMVRIPDDTFSGCGKFAASKVGFSARCSQSVTRNASPHVCNGKDPREKLKYELLVAKALRMLGSLVRTALFASKPYHPINVAR